jgi:hypothetical protein
MESLDSYFLKISPSKFENEARFKFMLILNIHN